jgi:RimJ/RimL family protein N-acetyltransferase
MEDPFRSKRLLYRAVEDTEDDSDFITSIQNNGRALATSSISLTRPQTKKETVEGYKTGLMKHSLLGVVICLPPSDEDPKAAATPVGLIALKDPGATQRQHRESDMSIDIAGPYQGKGYGTEAIQWAIKWGFQTANLHRIAIAAFEFNEAAIRLYKKVGFVEEGRRRESVWHAGRWWDGVLLSMLEHEWREKYLN